MNLKSLNDTQLINDASTAVAAERRITAETIKYFFEINRRRLHLKMGYDSLFTMLRKHFGYCEPTAQLRKNAVMLMRDVPEVIDKIESGEMPVTVAANIQSFLYSEKRSERPYSLEAKIELIETCAGKSVRDVQKEFVRRNPEIEKREVVRATNENQIRVSHSLSNEVEAKLQRIKLLWSHVDPNMTREQLLDRMAEITLEQIDPLRKAARANRRKLRGAEREAKLDSGSRVIEKEQTDEPSQTANKKEPLRAPEVPRSRYVSQIDRHSVHNANPQGACEFVDSKSGRRCESKFQLQVDHVVPHSQGGANGAANLRIFCGAHNRFAWASRGGAAAFT